MQLVELSISHPRVRLYAKRQAVSQSSSSTLSRPQSATIWSMSAVVSSSSTSKSSSSGLQFQVEVHEVSVPSRRAVMFMA